MPGRLPDGVVAAVHVGGCEPLALEHPCARTDRALLIERLEVDRILVSDLFQLGARLMLGPERIADLALENVGCILSERREVDYGPVLVGVLLQQPADHVVLVPAGVNDDDDLGAGLNDCPSTSCESRALRPPSWL